jgi:hypothetical protein
MADYFKFCPKCGRVLERDYCPHCEPEKEKEFRRKQQKLDDGMFDTYSEQGRHLHKRSKMTGYGSEKQSIFGAARETIKESGGSKRREKKVEEEASLAKRILSGVILLFTISVFVLDNVPDITEVFNELTGSHLDITPEEGSFFGKVDDKVLTPVKKAVNHFLREWNDENIVTVDEEMVDSLLFYHDYTYYTDDQEYYLVMGDSETDGNYSYTVDGMEYGYTMTTCNIYKNGQKADGKVQQEMDEIYRNFSRKAKEKKKKRRETDGYLESSVTYYDNDHASILIEQHESDTEYGDKFYSFVLDMKKMEQIPLTEFVQFDEHFYDIMEEGLDYDFSREQIKKAVEKGDYYYCFDQDGTLWVGVIPDAYTYGQVEFKNITLDR